MKKTIALFAALFLPMTAQAQNLSPWLGNFLEFNPGFTYTHMSADKVNIGGKTKNRHLDSRLSTLACSLVFDPSWDVQFTLSGGKNVRHSFQFRQTGLSVRHLFTQDLWAGTVSCSGGGSVTFSDESQLRDLLQMQKSTMEATVHGSIGYEHIFKKKLFSHVWVAAALGIGGHACTWVDGEVHADMIAGSEDESTHRLGLFMKASQGFGRHSLHLDSSYPYQNVHYHYADAGVSYYYSYCSIGSLAFEIAQRIAARNCPKDVLGCKLTLTIPFSL